MKLTKILMMLLVALVIGGSMMLTGCEDDGVMACPADCDKPCCADKEAVVEEAEEAADEASGDIGDVVDEAAEEAESLKDAMN